MAAIANTIFTFVLEKNVDKKITWVIHTHEVITESERLLSSMTDSETGQRGYILTEDSNYLEPFHIGLVTSKAHLNKLIELTSDNPIQQERLAVIQSLIIKKNEE